ncbi:MAG: hypothetical protein MH321_12180 [Leptospiraceae bacterium]|nr:hypothetical protein [Leptospiraceae bacterium]
MKITIQADSKTFSFTEMNFSDIKTIRDACKLYSKNGSSQSNKILEEIEVVLENAVL